MRALLPVGFFLLVGCNATTLPADDAPNQSTRQAVVGGTTDTGDPQVFELYVQGNNNMASSCTATLIDRRTLVTAAHCVDPRELGATSIQIFAHNKTRDADISSQNDFIRVIDSRFHPNWDPNGSLAYDIGLAQLETAPNVTPKQWNRTSIDSLGGRGIRVVGYGSNVGGANGGTGAGTRRQANLTFRQIYQDIFMLGNQQNIGICHGDSGGPSFFTFPDGVERLVGIHSFTNGESCLDGADTRIDYYQSFVQTWLTQKESPTCAEDGRCATGCATPDIDCVCAADGQCTAACPQVEKDPDCPKDCAANAICATQGCPSPDPDCRDLGAVCTGVNQCQGRLCITDQQHATPFCSKACTAALDCPTGMQCDPIVKACTYPSLPEVQPGIECVKGQSFCASHTVCTGKTEQSSFCQYSCSNPSQCPTGDTCEPGFDGTSYCVEPPKPTVYLPSTASFRGPVSGCSATGSSGLVGLAAWVLARRRRRSFKAPEGRGSLYREAPARRR